MTKPKMKNPWTKVPEAEKQREIARQAALAEKDGVAPKELAVLLRRRMNDPIGRIEKFYNFRTFCDLSGAKECKS